MVEDWLVARGQEEGFLQTDRHRQGRQLLPQTAPDLDQGQARHRDLPLQEQPPVGPGQGGPLGDGRLHQQARPGGRLVEAGLQAQAGGKGEALVGVFLQPKVLTVAHGQAASLPKGGAGGSFRPSRSAFPMDRSHTSR